MAKPLLIGLIGRFTSRLRFPQLFTVAALLFGLDLLLPDMIPFVDEILLGLLTALLAVLEKPRSVQPPAEDKPPMKDVTPPR